MLDKMPEERKQHLREYVGILGETYWQRRREEDHEIFWFLVSRLHVAWEVHFRAVFRHRPAREYAGMSYTAYDE